MSSLFTSTNTPHSSDVHTLKKLVCLGFSSYITSFEDYKLKLTQLCNSSVPEAMANKNHLVLGSPLRWVLGTVEGTPGDYFDSQSCDESVLSTKLCYSSGGLEHKPWEPENTDNSCPKPHRWHLSWQCKEILSEEINLRKSDFHLNWL